MFTREDTTRGFQVKHRSFKGCCGAHERNVERRVVTREEYKTLVCYPTKRTLAILPGSEYTNNKRPLHMAGRVHASRQTCFSNGGVALQRVSIMSKYNKHASIHTPIVGYRDASTVATNTGSCRLASSQWFALAHGRFRHVIELTYHARKSNPGDL